MKIKKFLGRNLQDAFDQMKRELGENAIILNTRKVDKVSETTGKKVKLFEVTAALDEHVAPIPGRAVKKAIDSYQKVSQPNQTEGNQGENLMLQDRVSSSNANSVPEKQYLLEETYQRQLLKTLEKYSQLESLKDEINEIKSAMTEMADLIQHQRLPALPPILKQMYKILLENEVDERLARMITQTVLARLTLEELEDHTILNVTFQKIIGSLIPMAPPIDQVKRRPYIVALVGPTGVGKTTTIAKIAANLKIFKDKKVGIITADTFRIAAVEQIQTFANIAGISMEVVYEPVEMPEALRSMRDRDVVLIDTVGRSQRKEEQIKDLKKFMDASNPHEVHLVMSLTASQRNLMDVVNRFSVMNPNRYIFTKLDEVNGPGNILNVCYKHKLPVSYVTTGQIVPDDILEMKLPTLTRLILQGF